MTNFYKLVFDLSSTKIKNKSIDFQRGNDIGGVIIFTELFEAVTRRFIKCAKLPAL
jgi:hypothetical protein